MSTKGRYAAARRAGARTAPRPPAWRGPHRGRGRAAARRRGDRYAGRSHAPREARRARTRSSRAPPDAPTSVRRGGAGRRTVERTERVERAAGASGGAMPRTRIARPTLRRRGGRAVSGVLPRSLPAARRTTPGGAGAGPARRRRGRRATTAAEAAEQAHEHPEEHSGLEEHAAPSPSRASRLEGEERRGGRPGQEQSEADERDLSADTELGGRERCRGHGEASASIPMESRVATRAALSSRGLTGSAPTHSAARSAWSRGPSSPRAGPRSGRGGWRGPRARSRARRTPRGPARRAVPPPRPASRGRRGVRSPRTSPESWARTMLRRGGVRTWRASGRSTAGAEKSAPRGWSGPEAHLCPMATQGPDPRPVRPRRRALAPRRRRDARRRRRLLPSAPLHGGTMRTTWCIAPLADARRGSRGPPLQLPRRRRERGVHDGEGAEEEDLAAALTFLAEQVPEVPRGLAGSPSAPHDRRPRAPIRASNPSSSSRSR